MSRTAIPAPPAGSGGGRRVVGLMLGLAWGAAIAWVQLRATWELKQVAGFDRPAEFLANYSLPPGHWAQLALPAVFLGRPMGDEDVLGPARHDRRGGMPFTWASCR